MLQMRARGFCLRDAYPDILKGMEIADGLEANAYNEQNVKSNSTLKTEEVVTKVTAHDQTEQLNELLESIQKCQNEDELRACGEIIRAAGLNSTNKQTLSNAYRAKLKDLKETVDVEEEPENNEKQEMCEEAKEFFGED